MAEHAPITANTVYSYPIILRVLADNSRHSCTSGRSNVASVGLSPCTARPRAAAKSADDLAPRSACLHQKLIISARTTHEPTAMLSVAAAGGRAGGRWPGRSVDCRLDGRTAVLRRTTTWQTWQRTRRQATDCARQILSTHWVIKRH